MAPLHQYVLKINKICCRAAVNMGKGIGRYGEMTKKRKKGSQSNFQKFKYFFQI